MEKNSALRIIKEMHDNSGKRDIGLIIAGSIGYKSAILHPERFESCDDFDCIFIYNELTQLLGIPYLKNEFLLTAKEITEQKKADMFSTKLVRNGIKLSVDFISENYMEGLSREKPSGVSTFRRKLTDAIEKNENTYCNIDGKKRIYRKPCEEYGIYRIYKLPIHWFTNGEYYPGVLLNKFLYNPTVLRLSSKQKTIIKEIQKTVRKYCGQLISDTPPQYRIYKTSYRKECFSEETVQFLTMEDTE